MTQNELLCYCTVLFTVCYCITKWRHHKVTFLDIASKYISWSFFLIIVMEPKSNFNTFGLHEASDAPCNSLMSEEPGSIIILSSSWCRCSSDSDNSRKQVRLPKRCSKWCLTGVPIQSRGKSLGWQENTRETESQNIVVLFVVITCLIGLFIRLFSSWSSSTTEHCSLGVVRDLKKQNNKHYIIITLNSYHDYYYLAVWLMKTLIPGKDPHSHIGR